MSSIATICPVLLLALLARGRSLGQDSRDPAPHARAAAPPAPPKPRRRAGRSPPAAPSGPSVNDDEFIPTEELAPDAAITFPVDI